MSNRISDQVTYLIIHVPLSFTHKSLKTNQFMNLKIKQVASLLFQSYGWSSIHSFRFCLFWCVFMYSEFCLLCNVFNCTAYTAAGVARAWYKSIAQHKSILECCRNHCEIAHYRELSIPIGACVFNTQCTHLCNIGHRHVLQGYKLCSRCKPRAFASKPLNVFQIFNPLKG